MARKKEQSQEQQKPELYIIERTEAQGIRVSQGRLGKAQTYKVTIDENGEERSELIGDHTAVKFPNSVEDLTTNYDLDTKRWDFAGDAAELATLVKEIGLSYPEGHPKHGEPIHTASMTDPNDAFFGHPEWRTNPDFKLLGGKTVLSVADPKKRFLLLCRKGNRKTHSYDDTFAISGTVYKLYPSHADDKQFIKESNKEMQLAVTLNELTHEKAVLISLIMGLIYNKEGVDPESVKPNLLTAVKNTDRNPNNDIRLFNGKSYQTLFEDLIKDDLAALNKKANIKSGMHTNVLRYREGSYSLKGKPLTSCSNFFDLVNYFSTEEGAEDYEILKEGLN